MIDLLPPTNFSFFALFLPPILSFSPLFSPIHPSIFPNFQSNLPLFIFAFFIFFHFFASISLSSPYAPIKYPNLPPILHFFIDKNSNFDIRHIYIDPIYRPYSYALSKYSNCAGYAEYAHFSLLNPLTRTSAWFSALLRFPLPVRCIPPSSWTRLYGSWIDLLGLDGDYKDCVKRAKR